jgi:hypothetical protein
LIWERSVYLSLIKQMSWLLHRDTTTRVYVSGNEPQWFS